MVLFPYVAFIVLLGWSLYDGDLDTREAGIAVGVLVIADLIFRLLRLSFAWYIVSAVILDIILVLKVFGRDIQIH